MTRYSGRSADSCNSGDFLGRCSRRSADSCNSGELLGRYLWRSADSCYFSLTSQLYHSAMPTGRTDIPPSRKHPLRQWQRLSRGLLGLPMDRYTPRQTTDKSEGYSPGLIILYPLRSTCTFTFTLNRCQLECIRSRVSHLRSHV